MLPIINKDCFNGRNRSRRSVYPEPTVNIPASATSRPSFCEKLIVLLLYLVTVGLVFLLYHSYQYPGNEPRFKIKTFLINPRSNVSSSQISTNWTVGISVRNSNKVGDIVYEGFKVSVFYEGLQYLCTANNVADFRQGPKTTTSLNAESGPCLQNLTDSLDASAVDTDFGRIAHFDVKFRVRGRYLDPIVTWLYPWTTMDVKCKDVKVMFPANPTQSRVLSSNECIQLSNW